MPMLSRPGPLPEFGNWSFEVKWDGFRAIVFVDGEEDYIQSRGGKSLRRYFPELEFAPGRWVLDGELVIRDAEGNLEFDKLQERIHPAASRIERLSKALPLHVVAWTKLEANSGSMGDSSRVAGATRLKQPSSSSQWPWQPWIGMRSPLRSTYCTSPHGTSKALPELLT